MFHPTNWKGNPQFSSQNCCIPWAAPVSGLLWKTSTQKIKKNPNKDFQVATAGSKTAAKRRKLKNRKIYKLFEKFYVLYVSNKNMSHPI